MTKNQSAWYCKKTSNIPDSNEMVSLTVLQNEEEYVHMSNLH